MQVPVTQPHQVLNPKNAAGPGRAPRLLRHVGRAQDLQAGDRSLQRRQHHLRILALLLRSMRSLPASDVPRLLEQECVPHDAHCVKAQQHNHKPLAVRAVHPRLQSTVLALSMVYHQGPSRLALPQHEASPSHSLCQPSALASTVRQ